MSHRPLIRRIRPYISHTQISNSQKWKYFPPWYPTTPVEKLLPALPADVKVPLKPLNAQSMFEQGPDARLCLLGEKVTKLVKFERIELSFGQAQETRMYTERLIMQAIRYGDCHRYTMELADFWLHEKGLVHKLFKVLVPRYADYTKAFTSIFKLAPNYELSIKEKVKWQERVASRSAPYPADYYNSPLVWRERAVLELKGNPLPPIRVPPPKNAKILTNVLMAAAREDAYRRMSEDDRRDEGEGVTQLDSAPEMHPDSEASDNKPPQTHGPV